MPKKELKEDAIDLRHGRVLELTSQGYSQRQIANMLQTSHRTVGFDQIFLRQKAKDNIRHYTDERLPEEYEKCLVSINSINREAWTIVQGTEDNKEKIQALSLAKECCSFYQNSSYSRRGDNSNNKLSDFAIRSLTEKSKEKLKSSNK
jgi:hypothetical protein